MNVPNCLSCLRILLTVPTALAIVRGDPAWAGGLLLAALATDFLDGWWARCRGASTALGRILDPLADKILAAGVLVALVASERVPLELAIVVVLRDVALLAFGWLRVRTGHSVPPAGPLGKLAFGVLGGYLVGAVLGVAWPSWLPGAVGTLYLVSGLGYLGRIPGFAVRRVARGDR